LEAKVFNCSASANTFWPHLSTKSWRRTFVAVQTFYMPHANHINISTFIGTIAV